jgi:hypothetical protein
MEKKGDLLNQLALISDLIEKMNLTTTSSTLVFELDEKTYKETFGYITAKYTRKPKLTKSFTIKMSDVDIVFNMNSDGKAPSS